MNVRLLPTSLLYILEPLLIGKQTAVRNLCVPTVAMPPPPSAAVAAVAMESALAAARFGSGKGSENVVAANFVRRQACRALKLLENCLAWQELLSPQALVPIALGDLVSKRLVPGLRALAGLGGRGSCGNSAAEEALALFERAVELLPVEWMERLDAVPLRLLGRLFGDGLSESTGAAAMGMGQRRGGGGGGGVGVERVVRLQVALGDGDKARELAQKHGLKIA